MQKSERNHKASETYRRMPLQFMIKIMKITLDCDKNNTISVCNNNSGKTGEINRDERKLLCNNYTYREHLRHFKREM